MAGRVWANGEPDADGQTRLSDEVTGKPALFLTLGVAGVLQPKVGMQTADTIVAANRDPDALLAEHGDLHVVGDIFEIGPALAAELRSRRG